MTTDLFTEAELAERLSELAEKYGMNIDDFFAETMECQDCIESYHDSGIASAIRDGWAEIEWLPESPRANYLGICPECKNQVEQSA